ncbi:MAG: TusE/DsrC/DsvC family sulfur relay protein [Gammaproteobacteria bacterium]
MSPNSLTPMTPVPVDKEGYLRDLTDWSEAVAVDLAESEAIRLLPAHWEVLHLLRAFYQRHQLSPANRALVSLVKRELGPEKGRSVYLMKLFGGSPAKMASKIAGLPKPDNCL